MCIHSGTLQQVHADRKPSAPRTVLIIIPEGDPSSLLNSSALEGNTDNVYNPFVLDGIGQDDDDSADNNNTMLAAVRPRAITMAYVELCEV